MQAIILFGDKRYIQRINTLQSALLCENIKSTVTHAASSLEISTELNGSLENADLAILHLRSPNIEFLQVIPEIRKRNFFLPIVVVDEADNKDTKKRAFLFRASAYFQEPFGVQQFAIECKQIIWKRRASPSMKWFRAFDVWIDLEHRFARRGNELIPLCNKEFSLLEFFIANRGKILSRSSIIEYVWDRNAHFASNTVDVHINRLRKKIDSPFNEKLIHTVPCVGYIFEKRKSNGRSKRLND